MRASKCYERFASRWRQRSPANRNNRNKNLEGVFAMTESTESVINDVETVESKPRGRRTQRDEQIVVEAVEPRR